ncbi:single-stranded-DNA-specific exonuclease RecJ [Tumebacillus lipolyticus]|uniref:Single-stranded-DNA-specific exonuclease RecJ n=1 Tax=Tumebacillus lipolyticus TaxID=1280370 RepID=A0ABW4ZTN7_9BACL
MQLRKRWVMSDAAETDVQEFAEAMGVSTILARLLWRRGVRSREEAQRFLKPSLQNFYDPHLMKDMDKTVERIRRAIEQQEQVMVYGDYDADGATATSVLYLALRELGARVDYYIPDRFSEGYGLNGPAIEQASADGYRLVITVDNGISAVEQVALANRLGLDLIITDHHTPPEVLPDAYAILNPKQPGCQYPDRMLAGVGVVFKLVQALYGRLPHEFFDLAALGTVADLAPLQDENRLITAFGLQAMNESPRLGIKALIEAAGLEDKKITAGHIGFSFGPRINASGRLDSATYAVELLTCEDPLQAEKLAQFLEERNRERQELCEMIFAEAIELVDANPSWLDGRVLVVANRGWNEGVIGIVASRLVERYHRPTLVFSIGETSCKASARSIAGFDLYQALTRCADLLGHYGGHKMAAGLSLAEENLDRLRERLNEIAEEVLTAEDLIPALEIDMEVDLLEVDLSLVEQMQALAPFGFGNPSPRFALRGLALESTRAVGKDAAHLQVRVRKSGRQLDCIAFRRSEDQRLLDGLATVDIAGELAINEWRGRQSLQLVLGDWQPCPLQSFDARGCRDKFAWLEVHKEALTVLCFQKSNVEEIEKRLFGYPWNEGKYRLYHVQPSGEWLHVAGEDEPTACIVYYDLPLQVETFERSLDGLIPTQSLYFIQGQSDEIWLKQSLFDQLPEREAFAYAYRILRQVGRGTVTELLAQMQSPLNHNSLTHILQVFADLGFAICEDETYDVIRDAPKRPLSDSVYYQELRRRELALRQVGDLMLTASAETMREWLAQRIQARK